MSARAFSIVSARPTHGEAGAAAEVELAHVSCQVDFTARHFGVRCGLKQLGERSKRHTHTLSACIFRPANCLLALAGDARGDRRLLMDISAWAPQRTRLSAGVPAGGA